MIADPQPGDPDVATAPELIWTAPAEAMELFATRAVARHGSLEAWPRAIGVSGPSGERAPRAPARASTDRPLSAGSGLSRLESLHRRYAGGRRSVGPARPSR